VSGVFSVQACELLCAGLPRAKSFDEAMGVIERARSMILGEGLLTVNVDATLPNDPPGEIQLKRVWTSQPGAYPVGGGKRKTRTPWTRQLLEQCKVFVGEGDQALAEIFDDHARIASLDLHAVVNVPIVREGRCVATFNVLGRQPRWQEHEIAAIRLLALLAAPHVVTLGVTPLSRD
jgi:GAF domain-containing protein